MQNDHRLRRTAWNFLSPYSEGTFFYLLVTVGVIISSWVNRLSATDSSFEVIKLVGDVLRVTFDGISAITSEHRALVFLLWFAVGSIVYIIIWLLANIAIDLYNDIIISSAFVHPKSFKQSSFWGAIASRVVLRIAATVILVVYGVFWVSALLPIWQKAFASFIYNPTLMDSAINAGIALALCLLSLHVMAILFRFITLKAASSY